MQWVLALAVLGCSLLLGLSGAPKCHILPEACASRPPCCPVLPFVALTLKQGVCGVYGLSVAQNTVSAG